MPAVSILPMLVGLLAAAPGPRVLVEYRPSPAPPTQIESEGARIWVDPTTGALTGTRPEGVAAPTSKVAGRFVDHGEDLPAFDLDEGGRGLHLAGRFQHAAVAVVGADGTIAWRCAAGDEHPQSETSKPEPR